MALLVVCAACRHQLKVVNTLWGKRTACRQCGSDILVNRAVLVGFGRSSKDPPCAYALCPGCKKHVPVIDGQCPWCSAVLEEHSTGSVGSPRRAGPMTSDTAFVQGQRPSEMDSGVVNTAPPASVRLERIRNKTVLVLTLTFVTIIGLGIAVSLALYNRSQTTLRQAAFQEQLTLVEGHLAQVAQATTDGEFETAREALMLTEGAMAEIAGDERQYTRLSKERSRLEEALRDAEREDSEKQRQEAEARIESKVLSQFSRAQEATDRFRFADAKEIFLSIEKDLAAIRLKHRGLYNRLQSQFVDQKAVTQEAEADYDEKIQKGWVIFEGELIPREERRRLIRERRAKLAEEQRQREEAERLAREEEVRRQRQEEVERAAKLMREALARAETRKADAYEMSKQFVRDTLKSPSSARFPKYLDRSVTVTYDVNNGKYTVMAWVEAQNVFGVYLRKTYICVLWPVSETEWKSNYTTLLGE